MQVPINNSYLKQVLVALLASLCYFPINAKSAISSDSNQLHNIGIECLVQEPSNCKDGKDEKSQNPINSGKSKGSEITDPNSSASLSHRYTHSKLEPTIPVDSSNYIHNPFKETGTNDISNLPDCGGICLYGNVKFVNESEVQAMIGIIWQLTSPEQTKTKIQGRLVDAQTTKIEDDQKTIWMDKLVTALRTGDFPGARGFAILLAPKLNKTPEVLINEITGYLEINDR
jgi:hypothetical protein